jgi:predicted Na+-dependent transporter
LVQPTSILGDLDPSINPHGTWYIACLLRAGRDQRASLMYGLGLNNNGAGLVLASVALANHPRAMLPIILYNLVQHLVAGAAYHVTRAGGPHRDKESEGAKSDH